ncbi:MAG: hypothetical protein IT372_13260 [Polyangiaceae bacterium]|nr:hypothetical protein [Polyangiaceae bacterium]
MRFSRLLFLVPAAAALLYACDDHEHPPPADIGGVILEGDVTDETFLALDSALDQGAPVADPAQAAVIDQPAAGAALPETPAPTFTWHIGGAASRSAPAALRRAALAPSPSPSWSSPLTPAPAAASPLAWLTAPLRELAGPIRSAHAHGDPYNGTATYLRFSTSSEPRLVEVLTSALTYAPAAAAWDKMTAAGAPITLTLVTAIFEQDRIAPDGGPFAGGTVTFTVAP